MLLNINKNLETSVLFVQNFPEMLKTNWVCSPTKDFYFFECLKKNCKRSKGLDWVSEILEGIFLQVTK
jgi:hypothetical protein